MFLCLSNDLFRFVSSVRSCSRPNGNWWHEDVGAESTAACCSGWAGQTQAQRKDSLCQVCLLSFFTPVKSICEKLCLLLNWTTCSKGNGDTYVLFSASAHAGATPLAVSWLSFPNKPIPTRSTLMMMTRMKMMKTRDQKVSDRHNRPSLSSKTETFGVCLNIHADMFYSWPCMY